ncbi:hypothetical protein B0H10DRAFT_406966 [Mycena sp. CBHHK59/15]|nr:hypothetical protein B0H10DRAFT_406966 [Mycena sp. CBHHK59/15]
MRLFFSLLSRHPLHQNTLDSPKFGLHGSTPGSPWMHFSKQPSRLMITNTTSRRRPSLRG